MNIFVVFIIVVSMSSISKARSEPEMNSEVNLKPGLSYDLCTNKSCLEMANTIMSNMKPDIEPCDDFYEFACGNSKLNESMFDRNRLNMNSYIAEMLMKPLDSSDSIELIRLKQNFTECLEAQMSIEDNSIQNSIESDNILRCVIKVKSFPFLFKELDQHYLDESITSRATKMFNLMIEEFVHKINTNQISWLQNNEDSKANAIAMINKIRLVFGQYKQLHLSTNINDLGSIETTRRDNSTTDELKDTRDETGAQFFPDTYIVNMHLASMLSREFIDLNRPALFDYAIFGSIMGHEINHSVDRFSRVSDIFGCVDKAHCSNRIGKSTYWNRTGCLENQYNELPFTANDTLTQLLSGSQTLSENIADNWGFKLSYETYIKTRGDIEAEVRLCGLEDFSERQLYWLAYASFQCARPESHVVRDVHSPWRIRLNYSLKNNPDFARDFGCPFKKSPMSPPDQCPIV